MVAFVIIIRFILYFCISVIVQNNVIDKGEMPNILRNMLLLFSSEKLIYILKIENCLTLVVKVENLKSITRRQNICHQSCDFLHASCCTYKLF